MQRNAIVMVLVVLGLASTAVWAHGGRTDRNGCHMDHKTGIRHCH